MKRAIVTFALILAVILSLAAFTSEDDAEKAAVKKAIEDYFIKGLMKSDIELLKNIIHEDWRLHNVRKGKLVRYARKDLFSWNSHGEDRDSKIEILYIDVTGDVAAAKTREDGGKLIWVDYFNLVKLDGKWWIIDKVAHPLPKKKLEL
jgi:hypothetical protein